MNFQSLSIVRDLPYGKGLFAIEELGIGVEVARFEGPLFYGDDLPESEVCYALWLAPREWLIPTSSARYINHSCDPNCKVHDDLVVRTLRSVRENEELTFSYNIVYPGEDPPRWDDRWSFRCLCGAPNCQDVTGWRSLHTSQPQIASQGR